jgi:hypothetical protein
VCGQCAAFLILHKVRQTVTGVNPLPLLARTLHKELNMIRLRILAVLCLCCLFYKSRGAVSSNCPNSCSSHGVCTNTTSVGTCECFPSFTGIDCSLRVCPSSTAWVDVPSTSLKAHAPYTECSNMVGCAIMSWNLISNDCAFILGRTTTGILRSFDRDM